MLPTKRHELASKMVQLTDLVPWSANPRRNDAAAERLAYTIQTHGWTTPLLVQAGSNRVIGGHTRIKAAIKLGLTEVPAVFLDVDDQQADAIAIADNRLGELAEWDADGLADILRGLQEGGADMAAIGYDDDELASLLAGLEDGAPAADDDVPDVAEGPPDSVLGEVYELGPHRLACGDCTDEAVWDALMGGEQLRCMWTDPPYGVSNIGGSKDPRDDGFAGGDELMNDDIRPDALRSMLNCAFAAGLAACADGASWYVAGPNRGDAGAVFVSALASAGVYRHQLVWAKDSIVFGRSDYHYKHEPIFYGWKPGAAHTWESDRKQTSVLEFDRPKRSEEHPTMKPVALVAYCIGNSTKPGWLVGDPFAGSGTTLMACAQEGRVARVIEIDPKYCDVIRRRWTRYAVENGIDPGPGALGPADG